MSNELELEKIIKDYAVSNTKTSSKRLAFFDEVFSKVRRGNREGNDAIKTIEKAYQEELKIESEKFNELTSNIGAIEAELKSGLDAYYENYNIENETKKLEDAKEKGMQPKQLIFRKETHDVNFKLDRILKEEKDILKAKQDEYDELEKTYQAKINELEKKLKYELNKEKQATINTSDESQKRLLETNDRREIKKLNKTLQEIRKESIKKIRKIRLEYLDLIKNENIDFANKKKDYDLSMVDINQDFKIKKQELESERKRVNLRYQIELDKYDFGSKRAINNLNKKMIAKKNSLILSYLEKEKDLVTAYREDAKEDIKKRIIISEDVMKVMDSNYKAVYETLKLSDLVIDNNYIDELKNIRSLFGEFIEFTFINISALHQEYITKEIESEYDVIKLFINAKANIDVLCKKDYKAYASRLEDLYNKFKQESAEKAHEFENKLDELYDKVVEFINSIFASLEGIWKDSDMRSKYHKELSDLFSVGVDENIKYQKDYYEHELNTFEYVDNVLNKYNDALSSSNKENDDTSKNHEQVDKEISDNQVAYNSQKEKELADIDSEMQALIKEINDDALKQKEEINNTLNTTVTNINTKLENDKKEIEDDYNTELNLLKN